MVQNIFKKSLYLPLLAVCAISTHAQAVTLNNGGVNEGEISISGEIDTYPFQGVAGENVLIRVADTTQNSSFAPRVELVDALGQVLTADVGPVVAGFGFELGTTDDYAIRVYDGTSAGSFTGTYNLYYAKIPGADEGGQLTNSEVAVDSIDIGDIDTYTFSASSGETVRLSAVDLGGQSSTVSLSPRLTLFSPTGALLTADVGPLVSQVEYQASSAGLYSVVVYDGTSGKMGTGDYELHYHKMPGANDGSGLSGGQVKENEITLGDIDSYAFTRNQAEANILISATDLDSGGLSPRISLYSPSGDLLVADVDSDVAQISATLSEAGQYTLLIYDGTSGQQQTGPYRLQGVGSFTGVSGMCNGLSVTVDLTSGGTATSGDDVILGTSGDDVISAFGGNDTICALDGDDTIFAGNGNDWVDAGLGNDEVQGSNGNDMIFGSDGADYLAGGPGPDSVYGEAGDDILYGNSGSDIIDGGNGVDEIRGGSGEDSIDTGAGATVGSGVIVDGGSGNDTIIGGPDADLIRGSTDKDSIYGGGGNDQLYGGSGEDEVHGESGNDLIRGNAGNDIITGGDGNDNINGYGSKDTIRGGAGNDVLDGSTGNDIIRGESGDDTLRGGGGNDRLFGDTGVDIIQGGGGNDAMDGGGNSPDTCNGQSGIDTAAASCEVVTNVP